mgnify:CR=1 FL=1
MILHVKNGTLKCKCVCMCACTSQDSSVMLHPPYTILVNFFRSLEKESVVLTDRSVQEQVNILLQEMLKRPSEGGLYRRTHVMCE